MTLQEVFDLCIDDSHTAFWLSFTNQGDTEHVKILPGILQNWKASLSEPHQRPMMYPQPDGGHTFDAEQDLRTEERVAGKPFSEAEAAERTKQYIANCNRFHCFYWQVLECARAGIRAADRLDMPSDRSALASLLTNLLGRDKSILDAAIVSAGRIAQTVMALPAPQTPHIDQQGAVTRLTGIRARLLAMRGEQLQDRDEMHARLRIQQAQAAKVYTLCAHAGLLSIMPTLPPFDMPDDHFVWVWRKLAEAMHANHPDRISALEMLANADSMPEWLNHAEQLIGAMIDLLGKGVPATVNWLSPGEQAKALKLKDGDSQTQLKIVGKVREKALAMGLPLRVDYRRPQYFVDADDWALVASIFAIQLNATKNDKRAWDAFRRIASKASFICRECFTTHRGLPADSKSCPTCGGKLQTIRQKPVENSIATCRAKTTGNPR